MENGSLFITLLVNIILINLLFFLWLHEVALKRIFHCVKSSRDIKEVYDFVG